MAIILLHVLRINYIKSVYNDEMTSAFSPTYFTSETTLLNYIGLYKNDTRKGGGVSFKFIGQMSLRLIYVASKVRNLRAFILFEGLEINASNKTKNTNGFHILIIHYLFA
jgi:hypothetical protein